VTDSSGNVSLFNGQTLNSSPLTVLEFHNSPCVTITVDNNNRYFVTGGSDSLIGVWDMQELMVTKTISNNDFKVITLNCSHDG
jgi:WD40 repeat protein